MVALAFWMGGKDGDGHCVIGAPSSGTVFSTDWPGPGFVGHTTTDEITSAWGLTFAGWAKAYFPNGVTETGIFLNETTIFTEE